MATDIILVDPRDTHDNLLPLTYTRPVSDLRVGIFTIDQRWRMACPHANFYWQTVDYLRPKYPARPNNITDSETIYVRGDIIPSAELVRVALDLQPGQAVFSEDSAPVAWRGGASNAPSIQLKEQTHCLSFLYDIFGINGEVLRKDFETITAGRTSAPLSDTVTVIGRREDIFVEDDAEFVEGCTLNTMHGPIYIGHNATVMEGSCLRGPVAVCDHAVVNMGARIYGDTTIGPWCKVGGELNNVVMHSYSNKAHDGFLGNAVIGQWCNIGGGCSASKLKNDYTEIKLWNYPRRRFLRTGLQFCGLIMADFCKAGVNTMLNTATVLGVGVNIHGSGFPRPFLASFLEGSPQGYTEVPMQRFFDTASKMMARRGIELTQIDIDILNSVRQIAENYR